MVGIESHDVKGMIMNKHTLALQMIHQPLNTSLGKG